MFRNTQIRPHWRLKGAFLVLLSIFLVVPSAFALERDCKYKILVKSSGSRINSITIPNGNVIANGDVSTSGTSERSAKSGARSYAAKAALSCFNAALKQAGTPKRCKVNDNPKNKSGAMKQYNIRNLRTVATNALCNQARLMGKGDTIRDYEIYVFTKGKGDVLSECSWKFNNGAYHTLEKGQSLSCSQGLSRAKKEERYSQWYDKSGSQIKQIVKDHCYRLRNGAKGKIKKYEVNNKGELRAYFVCS